MKLRNAECTAAVPTPIPFGACQRNILIPSYSQRCVRNGLKFAFLTHVLTQAASIILENSRASTAELWTWEKSFRASKFLSSVVKHQREVAEGILASLNSSAQKLQENHSR